MVDLNFLLLNSQSLLEMGTKDLDFVQLNQLIGRKTGGISVYPFTSSVKGKEEPCSRIIVRGKAMSSRTEDLFNLVNQFIMFQSAIALHHSAILNMKTSFLKNNFASNIYFLPLLYNLCLVLTEHLTVMYF